MTTNTIYDRLGGSTVLQTLGLVKPQITVPTAITYTGKAILLLEKERRAFSNRNQECKDLKHSVDPYMRDIDKLLASSNVLRAANHHQHRICEGSTAKIKLLNEDAELILFVDHFTYPHSVFPIISLVGKNKCLRGKQAGDYGVLEDNSPYQILEILPDDMVFDTMNSIKNQLRS